jgi:Pyridoxamine 5'-phosphate oxidase
MGPAASTPLDAAIVLATVDPNGWAHPALLSYAEVLALDASRLRLGLHAGSRSARHLGESGRATLVFADAELCLYVKGEAVALPGARAAPDLARFELLVRDVLQDRAEGEEAGARLSSGLTIAWPGDPREAAGRFTGIRGALRE